MSSKLRLLSAVRAGTLGLLWAIAGCGGGSEHDDDGDDTWQPPDDDDTTDDAGAHTDAGGSRSDGGTNRDAKVDDSPDSSGGDWTDGSVPSEDAGGDWSDGSVPSEDAGGDWSDGSVDSSVDASKDSSTDATIDSSTDASKDSATDARADSATDTGVDGAADPVAACLQGAAGRGENTADPCVQCGCNSCASQLSACYGATDVAGGGPAQGTSRGVLCAAVVECGRESGCTGQECYCGTASTISCGLGGGANGPCKTQIERAAETTSALTIQQRQSNTSYAIGRANAVSDCSVDHCSTQCEL